MFERFTDEARRVLVLAQEEARLLNHNFIGTEHILLGLIHQGDGVAAQALGSLGIRLEAVREAVEETIGPARTSTTGSPPFTPRAKKVLELSLRESLQLGHNYIGTEHILLGLVREGEGVAGQVLVSLGAELSRVRQRVIQLVSGADVPAPETEGEAGPAPSARPRCSRCRARLSESARYTRIEAPPGDDAVEGQGPLSMTVFYCGHCGTVLGAPVETGPMLMGPVTSTVRLSSAQVAVAERPRRFPDELLGPVRLEDVPGTARVELSCRDSDVIEGTVAGTAVRLAGRIGSHRGSMRGTWDKATVEVNWRLGDKHTPTSPSPGTISGRFGNDPIQLEAHFQLGPHYWLERAEVSGDLCGQGLRAEVSAADGGLGSTSAVVAEGTVGEAAFELFAALSDDLYRAVVRGSVGGRPVSLDATRDGPLAPVWVVGAYSGPPPLLGLVVGALAYFL